MARRLRTTVVLTDDDRATLLSWTRSRACSRALAQRAEIVLVRERKTTDKAVAEQLGVSRDMVAKWCSRYLADGLDGLNERPRSGRPSTVGDDTVVQVLVRLLAAPPANGREWSTRSMAAETGFSQTMVNRIWRAYRLQARPGRLRPGAARTALGSAQVRDVVGLFIDPPMRMLALVADGHATPPQHPRHRDTTPPAPAPPVHRRTAEARNILAVANAFAQVRGGADAHGPRNPGTSPHAFLATLEHSVGTSREVHLLVGSEPDTVARDAVETWVRQHPRFHEYFVPADASWLDEVEVLLANNPLLTNENVPGFATSLAGLRDNFRAWSRSWTPLTTPFAWTRLNNDSAKPDSQQEGTHGPDERDLPDEAPDTTTGAPCLDDPAVRLVREALLTGRFPPGERVKEAPLASRLGISRGSVRKALGVLAEEGMLDRLPHRGAAVPHVDVTSVLDVYAIRAALGTVLMRRAAMLDRSGLRSVSTALAEVREVARRGAHSRIGEADLSFQDAIARTTNLPQASLYFQRLTMRIRMFIAILQLDFADAGADLIAREDAAILKEIRNGDSDEAARVWRVKVERSARYMANLLPQDRFDPNLWVTIAGKPTPRPGD